MIGKKRGPFKKDKDEKIELKDLFIDIGASDGDEARSLVRVGDGAVLAPQPVELRNNRVASRSWDNRVGCYVALETARRVAEAGGAPGDVVAVAAVGEEVGDFAGARTTAYAVRPDVAIAIDVYNATDIPGRRPERLRASIRSASPRSAAALRSVRASSSSSPRRRSRSRSSVPSRSSRETRTPTRTPTTSAARAFRPVSSRSRRATSTRRPSSSRSTTSRTRCGCSSRSPATARVGLA